MVDKNIDNIDEKILNELLSDAKKPLRELSQKIGVSFVTVMNRIKKLERKNIIKQYVPRIDYEKLGYGVHVLIEMRISKGKIIELEKRIAKSRNVYALHDVTGEFDAILLAKFKTTRSMDKFLKEIQSYPFVERTNTKLVLNTIKERQIRL